MDKRKKRVLTVLCLGSLVLVWRVYAICVKYLPSSAEAQPVAQPAVLDSTPAAIVGSTAPTTVVGAPTMSDDALAERLAMQSEIADRAWGRDPFEGPHRKATPIAGNSTAPEPVAVNAPDVPELKIVGVSQRDGDWITIINGVVYRVGDEMPLGFTVRRIARSGVTLESSGWAFNYTLGMPEPSIARIDGDND